MEKTQAPRTSSTASLLKVDCLNVSFATRYGVLKAVSDMCFDVRGGETLGIVGESGCGKSVTALSILGLLAQPPARISGGPVWFEDQDLLSLSKREIRRIRGNRISMVFQEPMTSLTPVLTIGRQIREVIMLHQGVSLSEAHNRGLEMLRLVQISECQKRMEQYPHELSGGMRQRIMIAMALSCNPGLLIADEPTTALDVTIQAQIIYLINDLKEKIGTSVIMITHDLGVVAETAQRVIVMYAGRKVEEAEVHRLFANPMHPYTIGLLEALPKLGIRHRSDRRTRFREIPGRVPLLTEQIQGCSFAPRCGVATAVCRQRRPPVEEMETAHFVSCWNPRSRVGSEK